MSRCVRYQTTKISDMAFSSRPQPSITGSLEQMDRFSASIQYLRSWFVTNSFLTVFVPRNATFYMPRMSTQHCSTKLRVNSVVKICQITWILPSNIRQSKHEDF